jgi:hypothetical protein
MTNLDDQIARHVKDMILRVTRKDVQARKQPCEAEETLYRAVRLLRGQRTYPPDNTQQHRGGSGNVGDY